MSSYLVLVANAGDSTVTSFALTVPDENAADAAQPALVPLASSAVGQGCSTFAIDEQRNLVYASAKGDAQGVDVFRLDRERGTLSKIGHTGTDGSMTYLTLARQGRTLVGASYGGGYAATFALDGEGGIEPESSLVRWPNAHCVATAEDGRHVYVVSLGADVVAQYALDEQGVLQPLAEPTAGAPQGSGPRHLVFCADEADAYVMTEFSGQVVHYRRDPQTGLLTEQEATAAYDVTRGLQHSRLGADPVEGHLIWGADVHLARGGRWVLASERCESTLASLPVQPDGSLGAVESVIDTEAQPRGFAVTPDGRFAVVTGERSREVALLSVSGDGSLQTVDRQVTGRGANWVRILA